MSTLASPRPATSPLIRLTLVEARLFLRQPATALTIFALPVVLTIGFGLIPSFGDPSKDLAGRPGSSTSPPSRSRSSSRSWG